MCAAVPLDGYEMLNMSLGFTGVPLPDMLLADIRIANLLVCLQLTGWSERE